MADTKITALAAITTVDPAADVLPIVDVSDTSMAASGTTKKITSNQILGAGGTATLASATITGDLTVDTSTLKVDSANNRVGIGTAAPISLAQLSGATPTLALSDTTASSGSFFNILFRHTDGLSATYNIATIQGQTNGNGGNGNLIFYTAASNSNTERYKIDSNGVATWSNVGGVAGTAMTLNSTGLGVGVTPITGHKLSSVGPIGLSAGPNSYVANGNYCSMYYTDGSGASFPFLEYGNLVIQPRNERNVVIATAPSAGNHVGRVVVKLGGQVRFVPLAADPSGAESGDVYYNSTSNKLKCYNGTTWNDLF